MEQYCYLDASDGEKKGAKKWKLHGETLQTVLQERNMDTPFPPQASVSSSANWGNKQIVNNAVGQTKWETTRAEAFSLGQAYSKRFNMIY